MKYKFRCALCEELEEIKKGRFLYFNEDTRIMVCEKHLISSGEDWAETHEPMRVLTNEEIKELYNEGKPFYQFENEH